MHYLKHSLLVALLTPSLVTARASSLDSDVTLNFERLATDGITLGEEATNDRLVESALELEISLDYPLDEQLLVFFTGTLFSESEVIKTSSERQTASGLELDELGFAYSFGEHYDAMLKLGRVEYSGESEWWVWWDESLDGLGLEANYGDWEGLFALTEPQARASSAEDQIDPEQEGIRRVLLSLGWEFADQNRLFLYLLDQADRSTSHQPGARLNPRKLDESDADLTWTGLSYLATFDTAAAGKFELELHSARVSGREQVYDIEEADDGTAEVAEAERYRVSGSASGVLFNWQPAQARDWTLIAGKARASGDANPDDSTDRSFRQTGLQGGNESMGELFQPELANLDIRLLGLDWRFNPGTLISLRHYRYQQRHAGDELRDSALEAGPSGDSRNLGDETDLVIQIESGRGSEWIFKLAEFKAGHALSGNPKETVSFVGLEFDMEF
jgi:hypothetical protein